MREVREEDVELVTITAKEYNKLIQDQAKYFALQGAGVDNWSGYAEAMDLYDAGGFEE